MSFRASLKNLIHRDPAASLRERAADLRASLPATIATAPAQAEQIAETGTEPATQALREQGDAELLALAPRWEAAVDLYQQRTDEEKAVCEAASEEGWPGAAPDAAGPEWRAWFQQTRDWRERTGVAAAEEASGEAGTALHKIEMQIAELLATSLAGLKLKARVAQRSDDIDVEWPEKLGTGLARDLLAFGADDDHPATVEEAASLDFTAYTFDTPTRDPNGWMKEFAHHAIGMHIADRTLRMSKAELVAFIQKGDERDPGVPTAMLDALGAAQKTFEGWGKLLDLALTRYLVAGSSAVLGREGATNEGAKREMQSEASSAAATFDANSLVGMLDLASATMRELQAIRDVAERVGSVAYTHAWSPRCQRRAHASGASNFNAAGRLVQWIGDALTAVESAAAKEAAGRAPSDQDDRETRLSMLAVSAIDNGDPDEIEAFARELLAHAAAERRGC